MSASNPPPSVPSTPADDSTPQLGPLARARAIALAQTFQADLVAVSQTVARHGGFNFIDEPHVNEAMATLRRAGLRRAMWFWQRPDFRVGIGGVLLGLGPTVSSVAKDVIQSLEGGVDKHPWAMWTFMISLPFVVCLAGGILAVWGWVDSDRG